MSNNEGTVSLPAGDHPTRPVMPPVDTPITGSWKDDAQFWHQQMKTAQKYWRQALKNSKQ